MGQMSIHRFENERSIVVVTRVKEMVAIDWHISIVYIAYMLDRSHGSVDNYNLKATFEAEKNIIKIDLTAAQRKVHGN